MGAAAVVEGLAMKIPQRTHRALVASRIIVARSAGNLLPMAASNDNFYR